MDILTNKIQIAVTEEEANIILSAITRFRGIYGEDQDLSHPDDKRRQERSLEVASNIRNSLELEFLQRYHESLDNSAISHP